MISIEKVNKRFSGFQALQDIEATFSKGQTVALIGPNGSGKTTLIKCMLGMVIPDNGRILFKDKEIGKDVQYRSHIGYMPQIGRFPDNMTIDQVFRMMLDIRGETELADTQLMESLGLLSVMNKRMRTLSGGTRQKVGASLAFLFNPEVLILDEPTAGLDPLSSEILKSKIIEERNKGKLTIITSHILSDLDDLITHVLYLQDGRVRFFQAIEQLKSDTGENNLSKIIAEIMKKEQ